MPRETQDARLERRSGPVFGLTVAEALLPLLFLLLAAALVMLWRREATPSGAVVTTDPVLQLADRLRQGEDLARQVEELRAALKTAAGRSHETEQRREQLAHELAAAQLRSAGVEQEMQRQTAAAEERLQSLRAVLAGLDAQARDAERRRSELEQRLADAQVRPGSAALAESDSLRARLAQLEAESAAAAARRSELEARLAEAASRQASAEEALRVRLGALDAQLRDALRDRGELVARLTAAMARQASEEQAFRQRLADVEARARDAEARARADRQGIAAEADGLRRQVAELDSQARDADQRRAGLEARLAEALARRDGEEQAFRRQLAEAEDRARQAASQAQQAQRAEVEALRIRLAQIDGDARQAEAERAELERRLASQEAERQAVIAAGLIAGGVYPSCWMRDGEPEFAFHVQLQTGGRVIVVDRAPRARRAEEAWQLLDEFPRGVPIDIGTFTAATRRMAEWSARQNPGCRFWISVRREIPADAPTTEYLRVIGPLGNAASRHLPFYRVGG